jgi:hypothetical protein
MRINHVAVYVAEYIIGHQSGLPRAANQLTPRGEAGNTHGNCRRKSFSADENCADETSGAPVARTVLTKGLVFDGTGTPPVPGEVILADDRVVSVTPGYRDDHGASELRADRVIDVSGCTVMPGLIESHGHLTFPSAVGHIDPTFNPPVDVSFFHHIAGLDAELARAERNARILLDAGFTAVYSAGSLLPMPTEVILRDKIRGGAVPGPRMLAASMERDNHPVRPDGHVEPEWQGPDACRAFVREQAAIGFDSVKFLLSNDDVFIPLRTQRPAPRGDHVDEFPGQLLRERGLHVGQQARSEDFVPLSLNFPQRNPCEVAGHRAELVHQAGEQGLARTGIARPFDDRHDARPTLCAGRHPGERRRLAGEARPQQFVGRARGHHLLGSAEHLVRVGNVVIAAQDGQLG